jgi:O-antigen/teichoic acid export membrane protein
MSLDVLFVTLQTTAGAAFAVRVRGDVLALMNVSARMLDLVGIVLTATLHGTYLGYISAYVGADLVVGVAALLGAHRSIPIRWNSNLREWWQAVSSALPLGVIQIIGSVYSYIDGILVSVLRSSLDLSYYSVALNIVNLAGAVPGFLMQALIPSLVDADEDEAERLVNRAVYVLFCVGAALAAGGIVLREDIVLAIAGQRFLPTALPLGILVTTLPISFVQNVLGYTSVTRDRYRPLVVLAFGALAVNVGVNLLVIPRFGPSGAASVLLGSEGLSLIATYFVFRHLSGIRVRWLALWRPTVASCAVLALVAIRGPVWSHENRIAALVIGSSLVAVVYILVLVLVRGVPEEIYKRSRPSSPPEKITSS